MILKELLVGLRPLEDTRGGRIVAAMLEVVPVAQEGLLVAESREDVPGYRRDTATRYVEGGDPAGYSLSLTPWALTLGTEVDPASLEAFGRERFASLVLSEMTAFGDTEAGMDAVRDDLQRRLENPGPGIPADEVMAKARQRLHERREAREGGGNA